MNINDDLLCAWLHENGFLSLEEWGWVQRVCSDRRSGGNAGCTLQSIIVELRPDLEGRITEFPYGR